MAVYERGSRAFYVVPVHPHVNPDAEFKSTKPHIDVSRHNGRTTLITTDIDKDLTGISLTDEEMEELFMVWQILRERAENE